MHKFNAFWPSLCECRCFLHTGESAIQALLSDAYRKSKKLPPITTEAEASSMMEKLLHEGFVLRAVRIGSSKHFQPDPSRVWNDSAIFAWVYAGSQLKSLLMALVAFFVVVAIVLYPLWPYKLQRGVWYLLMAGLGFFAFIMLLGVVRLIIFALTFIFLKPGWWLFPNLFEDCGFFESFVPFGCWHGEDVRPEHLKKSKSSVKND